MAAARRGNPLRIDLASASMPSSRDLPPIAALFQIVFDIKAGYTIAWKRAISGVELEGVVEFKSLPSGLHTVREDLIYFVHDQYAGVSAFVNSPAGEEERNALMLAVGILVPLSYGRLGRSWRHARSLKHIARELAIDTSKTQALEDFWETYRLHDELGIPHPESPFDSPSSLRFHKSPWTASAAGSRGHMRNRSASDATGLVPAGQTLTPFHPALSLLEFLHMFGPLVFPIYRAALARKRILLLTKAPVEQTCNFVYDISILSNVPHAVADLLATEPSRLKPIFTVGVHDIPMLEEEAKIRAIALSTPSTQDSASQGSMFADGSWVACTTDGVLYQKENLYDVSINMPPPHSKDAKQRIWPSAECPRGTQLKATQRDLRRYRALRRGLNRHHPGALHRQPGGSGGGVDSLDQEESTSQTPSFEEDEAQEETTAEPLSWPELAYSSFMWWASAGEKREDLDDQEVEDAESLLRPPSMSAVSDEDDSAIHDEDDADTENAPLLPPNSGSPSTKRSRRKSSASQYVLPHSLHTTPETDIIAYFHRLTTRILNTLSRLVDSSGGVPGNADADGEEEEEEEESVYVSSEDVARMGLDVWSDNDRVFVEEIMRVYFGRVAEVERAGLECCGVRIC
ncbi:hypothetical protein FGG08_004968 [Glutinoglossum americanum]|uniref:DUF4484 domain-containing protein n=1 Tax=Glutinoglossum americanum TaxID=1670608 RepID=A0A9P8IAB9_9PEZI|nr:hypothetical protein FGG08_004968 [Glutinoglossum americanum]